MYKLLQNATDSGPRATTAAQLQRRPGSPVFLDDQFGDATEFGYNRCVAWRVRICVMATNLAIDDALIKEAVRVGEHKSKKAAVTAALEAYIRHHRQQQILELFGSVDYDPDFDYKAQRTRS